MGNATENTEWRLVIAEIVAEMKTMAAMRTAVRRILVLHLLPLRALLVHS